MVSGWWLEKEGETSIFRAKRRNRWLKPLIVRAQSSRLLLRRPFFEKVKDIEIVKNKSLE
jgi:hypothetical protein